MRSLIAVLSLSTTFISSCSLLQKSQHNEVEWQDRLDSTHQYTQDSCYSRSIQVSGNKVYTANSNGEVYAYNLDSQTTLQLTPTGPKKEELRDLSVVNGKVIALQSGSTGKIIIQHESTYSELEYPFWKNKFLDGMEFRDSIGFIMGDPLGSQFSLYLSTNYGVDWKIIGTDLSAYEGEAGFAASGTNVQILNDTTLIFVSGGMKSRIFISNDLGSTWNFYPLPFESCSGCGPFSVYFLNPLKGIVVGGDYTKPNQFQNTCFFTVDGGKSWQEPNLPLSGYRSAVHYSGEILYACGTNGIDYSTDFGKTWHFFAEGNFFALTSDELFLYATMSNGRFAKFRLIS